MERTIEVTGQKKPKTITKEKLTSYSASGYLLAFPKTQSNYRSTAIHLGSTSYQVQSVAILHTKQIMNNAILALWSLYFKENADQEENTIKTRTSK